MEKAVYKRFLREEPVGPPPLEQGHGGSFGAYFQEKKRKINHQFAKQQGNQGQASKIFLGVRIHVNGYTVPSHQELRQLMALHGGTFVNYYNRSQVTHFICNNLPDVKLKQMQRERNPVPVVRSEWIVASIRAGRLLSIKDFLLNRVRDAPGQQALLGFNNHNIENLLPREKYPVLEGNGDDVHSETPAAGQDTAHSGPLRTVADMGHPKDTFEVEDTPVPSSQLTQMNEERLAMDIKEGELEQDKDTGLAELVLQPVNQNQHQIEQNPQFCRSALQESDAASDGQPCTSGANDSLCVQEASDKTVIESNSQQEEDSTWAEARQIAASKRAACSVLKGPPLSTRSGPSFMDTYFKASRLHFIGTWRGRIEALAASMIVTAPKPVKSGTSVGNPVLRGKPIVVCHSNSENGTGEVSAANYEARAFGINSGCFIAKARKLCPNLIVVPYEFEKYQAISEKVYKLALSFTGTVEPISCDEAFLDITGLGDPENTVKALRQKIFEETECTASAGIGPNLLLARLATRRGKPNGQFRVLAKDGQQFVSSLVMRDFHGVGRSLQRKLASVGIKTVADLLKHSKDSLQKAVGQKTGQVLFDYARGRDEREVEIPKPRRSIGAECNWGIRFDGLEDAKAFLRQLSQEVSNRLVAAGVRGRGLTLKVKRRREGAREPSKFLGCGICDSLSRSLTISGFTNSGKEIFTATWGMLAALGVPAPEIRGVGVVVSKFDTDAASIAAKVSLGAAPSRAKAPPAVHVYDKKKPHPWVELLDETNVHPSTEKLLTCIPEKLKDYKLPRDTCNLPAARNEHCATRDSNPAGQLVGKLQRVMDNIPGDTRDMACTRVSHCDISTTVALPPASQIDSEVWDALPLLTRRELEHEYKVQKGLGQPKAVCKEKRRGRKLKTMSREAVGKMEGAGDFDVNCIERKHSWVDLRYSQLDPLVLAELPDTIRQEVVDDVQKAGSLRTRPSSVPVTSGLHPHNSDSEPCIEKVIHDNHVAQLEKEATGKEICSESSQIMERLRVVEKWLSSKAEGSSLPSDTLTDIHHELYSLLTSLNPMSDGITLGLRFIGNLGNKFPYFMNTSIDLKTTVLDYIEKKHGVRVSILNPLFDK